MKPFDAFIIRYRVDKQPLMFTLSRTKAAAMLALLEAHNGKPFDKKIFEVVKLTVTEKELK